MKYKTDLELTVSGADLYDYKVKVSPDAVLSEICEYFNFDNEGYKEIEQ